jgi:hypothetical protein
MQIMRLNLRHKVNWALKSSLALFATLLLSGCVNGKTMDNKMTKFERLIDRILSNPPSTPEAVQTVTGIKITPTDANDSFRTYEGKSVASETSPNVTIELRTPVSTEATSGPLLILNVSEECLGREALEARHGALEITQIPRGKSMDEETVFSKKMGWGVLSFGFPENNKTCVKTVTLNFNRR